MNTQSGKQEGLSNTDTKHSTNIADDPDKSTKGEGTYLSDLIFPVWYPDSALKHWEQNGHFNFRDLFCYPLNTKKQY